MLHAYDFSPIRKDLEWIAGQSRALQDDVKYQYFAAAIDRLGEIEDKLAQVRGMIEACEVDYMKGTAL